MPRRTHAVIAASAGTGKTFAIENLVIDLLLREGVPLERDPRPDFHGAGGSRASEADPRQDREDTS